MVRVYPQDYRENQERGLCAVGCPTCRVYTWALAVGWSEKKLKEKLHYMHRNPVDRKLVQHPQDWPWSSWSFYAKGEQGLIRIDELTLKPK